MGEATGMPGSFSEGAGPAAAPAGGREGLYISRVPTVVTLSQLEAEADQKKLLRCSAEDLRRGHLPLLQAPLMPPGAFCSKKRISSFTSFGNLAQAAAGGAGRERVPGVPHGRRVVRLRRLRARGLHAGGLACDVPAPRGLRGLRAPRRAALGL